MSGENQSSNEASNTNNEVPSTVENEITAIPIATNEAAPNEIEGSGNEAVSKQIESAGNEISSTLVEGVINAAAFNQDGPSKDVNVHSNQLGEGRNRPAEKGGIEEYSTPVAVEASPIEISTPLEVGSNATTQNLPEGSSNAVNKAEGVTNIHSNQEGGISAENVGIEVLYPTSVDSTRTAANENSGLALLNGSSLSHVQVLVPRAVPGIEVTAVSKKECWICRTTEDEDPTATWAQPCRCKGSTQWVHRECLRLWVDEKLKDNRRGKISCPQCKTPYLLQFPQPNILVKILEKIDSLIDNVSPTVAVVILAGSIYWCALTYGAVTMIQISDDSSDVLEQMDQSVLLMALPAIPVGLIALEMYHWEDSLLAFLRRVSPHLPVFKHILPAPVTSESGSVTDNLITDGMNCTRVFTSGLLLPTIATIIGNIFFSKMNSGVERAVVAGVTFIVVKGVLKMYHKQQTYKRKSKRKILDYTQENLNRTAAASNTLGPSAALNIESYRLPPAI